jgi:hypothetical protein
MLADDLTKQLLPSKLKPSLDSRLMGYVTVATATGVTALAFGQSATAEIVYTPADINVGTYYSLDINHDGVPDFTLETVPYDSGHGDFLLLFLDVPGNAVRPPFEGGGTRNAAALPIGAHIGPAQTFTTHTTYGGVFMGNAFQYGSIHDSNGPWLGATNKFLGLKFLIDGEVHYGWARLTVTGGISATISGYAYETVSNKVIWAGQRSENQNEKAPVSLPNAREASELGLLACGASGLALWRREQ